MTMRCPWAGRGIALAVLFALAPAGAAALPGTADAAGVARVESRLAHVVAPRDGATIDARAVTVRVRLRPNVVRFSASVGRTDATRRFARSGTTRVATLRIGGATRSAASATATAAASARSGGDGLRLGANRLVIRARDRSGRVDLDVVRFTLVRRDASLLRVTGARRSHGVERVGIRLSDARARLTARLNGRPVPVSGELGKRRALALAGDDGLRFGKNTLHVTALDRARGKRDSVRLTVRVGRNAPIPSAGEDRRAIAGRVVVLDARRSQAASTARNLGYRWRVVRKPRGSHARLRDATARRPRLKPDRPGVYRVRLTLTERVRKRGQRVARASATATGSAGASATVTTSDTATLSVTPPTPAIGLPLNTIASANGATGVQVGTSFYAAPNHAAPLQLVVLDRATLELRANASYTGDDAGTASLKAAVQTLDDTAIAIIATPRAGAVVPIADGTALANVNAALAAIGAPSLQSGSVPAGGAGAVACANRDDGACAGFSAIGIRGLPAGQGTLNPGLAPVSYGQSGTGGALRGYLQLDDNRRFTYVNGDYVPFDTTAPGTSDTQAVISVGGRTYSSQQLTSPAAGAYVLVLDAGTLKPIASGTWQLRAGPVDNIVLNESFMDAFLRRYVNDPTALVFVQSIGRLARWDDYEGDTQVAQYWNAIAADLQRLGGHAMLFDAITDSGYTQVGPAMNGDQNGYPAPWTSVAGPTVTNTPAQLSGTLARNSAYQFYAKNGAAGNDPTADLPLLAYQPATAWPLRDNPADVAAIACAADAVGLSMPIEANYGSTTLDWGTRDATVSSLAYDGLQPDANCQPGKFTAADLAAVKHQLDLEFTALSDLRNWIASMKQPFTDSVALSALNVTAISDQIQNSVNVPDDAEVKGDPLGLAEDAFLLLGAMPGIGELSGGDLIASMIGLAADTTTEPDGTKALEYDPTTAAELGTSVDDDYLSARDQFDHVFAIIAGDWGKLSTADERVKPGGEWEWSDGDGSDVVDALGFAAQRQLYTELFPQVYDGLLKGTQGTGTWGVPADARQYQCTTFKQNGGTTTINPFGGASADGWGTFVTSAGSPTTENWVFANANEISEDDRMLRGWEWKPQFPSEQLTSAMFATPANGIGIPPLQQLPFALSLSGVHVLTLRHQPTTGLSDTYPNTCYGG
jgi:hypothetical protein